MANKQFCNRNYHRSYKCTYISCNKGNNKYTHAHTLRQGQKVKRKNRRNSNISKPKGGKRRPTKSPNVARRKTKLRGQITSPDTSPVRRGGGMSMTL